MSKSKKILYISTVSILIILIVCTVLSKFISEAIMPTVEVLNPVRMELSVFDDDTGEVITQVYEIVLPVGAIIEGAENRKYVYIIRQRKGLFGQEHYAVFLEVRVIADDDIYVALGGWSVTMFDDVVLSSSDYLTSGEVVKVINK